MSRKTKYNSVTPGQIFNRLTTVKLLPEKSKSQSYLWLFRCSCGKEKIAEINRVVRGDIKSCGCLLTDTRRSLMYNLSQKLIKHGRCKDPVYRSWSSMMGRCYSPASAGYKYYGAQGIEVCKRWHSVENFIADMGERPVGKTLDRIDNKLGYFPENCRWATYKEQAENRKEIPPGKTGHRGVYWLEKRGVYVVIKSKNSKKTYLGVAKTLEEAVAIYKEKCQSQ